jgi:hypothetical protein
LRALSKRRKEKERKILVGRDGVFKKTI